jgi:chemotaxis protein CheC
MKELTEIQKDALRETINISIGKAASTFNQMIQEHIKLSVPDIRLANSFEALNLLKIDPEQEVCYVEQRFEGSYFVSYAMLIFTENESLELVKLFLGSDSLVEEMSSLETEAMNEIGNIILNASIGSLANLLRDHISSSLPVCIRTRAKNIFGQKKIDSADLLLLIFIDFGIESKKIMGYIVLVLELNSFDGFVERLMQSMTE